MRYMGGKVRLLKELLPIINSHKGQPYIEPFAGGMNVICNIKGPRVANDLNYYLISMWKALANGWRPEQIDSDTYTRVRLNPSHYPPHLVGWVGFCCTYSGKWFGGFSGYSLEKTGVRNYQAESLKSILNQLSTMADVEFTNMPYNVLSIPEGSLVYCDPPYAATTSYAMEFDNTAFWSWVRRISKHSTVLVSEYQAPPDFECIWAKSHNSTLSNGGGGQAAKITTERLFRRIK